VTFVFPDGSKYLGEAALEDGVLIRHGRGRNEQADTTLYVGDWKRDKMHGLGMQVMCMCARDD
jgi:hypothetical protein